MSPGKMAENAPLDDLPLLLVEPPWKQAAEQPKAKEAPLRVVAGLEAPSGLEMVWPPGRREEWAATRVHDWRNQETWEECVGKYRAAPASVHPPADASMFALAPEDLVRPLLPDWRPENVTPHFTTYLRPIVARFGPAAHDPLLHCARLDAATCGEALLPFLGAEVVRRVADWMFRLKTAQEFTRAYFAEHGLATVPFLVPDAVGKSRPARRKAAAALALLAGDHGADAVVAAARVHGDEAAEIVAEALSERAPIPDAVKTGAEGPPKEPRLPWLEVAALPRPVLRDSGRALPPTATGHLVSLMALSGSEPYEGLAEVFERCTPESLTALSWAVFEAWRAAGEPPRNAWVLSQLGWLGDDETARRLSPIIRAWPGRNGHPKAVQGLAVLTAIGSDVALVHLNGIAQKVKFNALKEAARKALAATAEARGLTGEQLADRLVPDFGLDAEGGMTLDYGPRRFRVGFDEQLRPYVRDDAGRLRKALPKPGAEDEAELADAAHRRFAALRKDVRTITADQIGRLEKAMVTGRRWTLEEFRTLFAGHPLIWHIARRLVWLAGDRPFRIAEDRTLADVADAAFTPPDGAPIGIAHPLHLGDSLKAWAELFADYEIMQPFPQLARPVHTLTGRERGTGRLARFEGTEAPVERILALTRRGWERGRPGPAGIEHEISIGVAPDRWVTVRLDPGIVIGDVDRASWQTLRWVLIAAVPHAHTPAGHGAVFGELDEVAASELLADLTGLTAE
ncbi:DUF4132 domain-containing protein [Spirillospora sp. NPDC127200]